MTYIIAEMGVNHNGDVELGKSLIEIAAKSGANAIKIQSFETDQFVTAGAPKSPYQVWHDQGSSNQTEMLKRLELTFEQQTELYLYSKNFKLDFISTPFDELSLNFLLCDLNLPIIKVASSDLTSTPLLHRLGISNVDVILSTGMANEDEIEFGVGALVLGRQGAPIEDLTELNCRQAWRTKFARHYLDEKVMLLHCISEYPAPAQVTNLNFMNSLRKKFDLRIGFSDHSQGVHLSVAAVALGAQIVEKHLTIDNALDGPDHAASLNPADFSRLVAEIRDIDSALGDGEKVITVGESLNSLAARKSLVAIRPINSGEKYDIHNLGIKRPGVGIPSIRIAEFLGKYASRTYKKDEQIVEE